MVNAARGQQAAKVAQAGLQAEGDEQRTLIWRVQAERVGRRRLRVGEKQAVEDAEQAASLGGAAPDVARELEMLTCPQIAAGKPRTPVI